MLLVIFIYDRKQSLQTTESFSILPLSNSNRRSALSLFDKARKKFLYLNTVLIDILQRLALFLIVKISSMH